MMLKKLLSVAAMIATCADAMAQSGQLVTAGVIALVAAGLLT
jgi:hypothetical protein